MDTEASQPQLPRSGSDGQPIESPHLDANIDQFDKPERDFVGMIRKHGWIRTSVLGEGRNPPFAYTTGFWLNADAPELMMSATKPEIVHDVFWDVYRETQAGRCLPVGRRTDRLFANLAAYAFPVARRHYPELFGWSRWFYGRDDFPCLQIVWPDPAGIFPWEPGFDSAFASDQADLTENGWRSVIAD